MAATEQATYIGAAVPRKEDRKLLTGQGSFVDNLTLPGMLWMALVRSPYPHARIVAVNVAGAVGAPGVVAAYSGHDLAEEWAGSLPCAWPVTEDIETPPHYPLAQDKARYEGDAVAVVVAESRAEALDAAELVTVEWEPLPAVTDVEHALDEGAPLVHDDLPSNRCYVWPLEGGDVAKAFADAEVTVSERYRQQRLIPSAIEPRGVLVQPVPATGELTLWSATQVPHILRVTLSGVIGMPESKLRVIAPDVGGGFGSKLNVYAEEALALALARRLGRPIKWTEERTEGFQATIHGRDVIQEIELAATKEGRLTGIRVRLTAAMGAYLQLVTPGIPLLGAWIYNGAYDKFDQIFASFEKCLFVGHSHTPCIINEDLEYLTPKDCDEHFVYTRDKRKIIVNVGSVGQPRDNDTRSCYVEITKNEIIFHRVTYDVKTTVQKIKDNNRLSDNLGLRLQKGV